MQAVLQEKLAGLPNNPGVYQFKNIKGEIIYVGKAKNLKNRVGSYFHTNLNPETKTGSLVARINDVDYIQVASEFDAIILEAELIKKYRPKYNIIQKDDKTYLYIVIRNEKVKVDAKDLTIPKVLTARQTELLPGDLKFGPYPDSSTAKFVVRTMRKIFPFRDCSTAKFSTYHRRGKPCLYGQIGLCSGPCVHYDKQSLNDYTKLINSIKKVLHGGSFDMLKELESQMQTYAKQQNYEQAQIYRDLINKFNYVRASSKSPQTYMENPMFIEDTGYLAMRSLQETLPILKAMPRRIECYDISNISGKEAVGSMVVAENGLITKREYKRFKIKYKSTPDDFDMLREVLSRRLSHHSQKADGKTIWTDPDLLVIDGGKGQISAVSAIMEKMSLNVPIIGLAKKFETIVYQDIHGFQEILLDAKNPGLALLIRLRDEAHRFAQDYHHKLRSKLINPGV
jgi:excinuclease ABC subunit C